VSAPTIEQGYAEVGPRLHSLGWVPLLLPAGQKSPPPKGWTGRGAPLPSWADIIAWAEDKPQGNTAMRLPATVVGIDVDAYDNRAGAATLATAESAWGVLPPTVRTTSRADGVSGIRLYRVPAGVQFVENLDGLHGLNVDMIQHNHRYVVAPGSTHPNGGVYRLLDHDGHVLPLDGLPRPEELPELPAAWVVGLTARSKAEPTESPFAPRGLNKHAGPVGPGGRRAAARDFSCYLRRRGVGYDIAAAMLRTRFADFEQPAGQGFTWAEAVRELDGAYRDLPEGAPDLPTTDRTGSAGSVEDGGVGVTVLGLGEVHKVFRRWLGDEYDTDVLDAVLAAAAVEKLGGDPTWLLVVSGSGAAKTETVAPLAAAGAHVTSTISSEGALLSGTSRKERSKDATGGLLRKIGDTGVLVIKDVTSVLSMNRDARGAVLAALREVYDGRWERNLGSDGGQTLTWMGRLVVIGAVTTAWDRAHEVVASMGDRFVLIRLDSSTGRSASGRQAIANTGNEVTMRAELGAAVAGVLAGVDTTVDLTLTTEESELILALADIVTLGRTGVEHDYRGDVIDAHAPEMPTRFAKQLTQILRGGLALGMDRDHLLRIVARCAADSMPPLRLAALLDLHEHPESRTSEVRKRIDKPRNTVDRTLQALHMLGLLTLDEEESGPNGAAVWRYRLTDSVDVAALQHLGRSRNVER